MNNEAMKIDLNETIKRLTSDIPYGVHVWLKSEAANRNTSVKNLVKSILVHVKETNTIDEYLK